MNLGIQRLQHQSTITLPQLNHDRIQGKTSLVPTGERRKDQNHHIYPGGVTHIKYKSATKLKYNSNSYDLDGQKQINKTENNNKNKQMKNKINLFKMISVGSRSLEEERPAYQVFK